jgi:hypothetical protein
MTGFGTDLDTVGHKLNKCAKVVCHGNKKRVDEPYVKTTFSKFRFEVFCSPKMNRMGMGSGTVQDLVAAYDGTSDPPFLRLEAGLVFLAV